MARLSLLVSLILATLGSQHVSAKNRLLDPLTTYTNGMPLASTDSLRNSNVYGQWDRYHLGCCDGRYNRPCVNSLCFPNCCCLKNGNDSSCDCPCDCDSMTGVEPVTFERLGMLPAPMDKSGSRATVAPTAAPLSSGGGSLLNQIIAPLGTVGETLPAPTGETK